MNKHKERVKLTNLLLEVFHQSNMSKPKMIRTENKFFVERCLTVMNDIRMIEAAANKHWLKPMQKIKARLSHELLSLSEAISPFSRYLSTVETYSVKFSDIWAALNQIEHEFGEYKFDQADKTLSVFTDTVILDGLSLGSFEIRLYIENLPFSANTALPYRVIALEPNPAASDSDITHPHVSHERLCEGDGYVLIRRAIEQGRICDFFILISNILQTYNPESAYASLDSWTGMCCHNCGDSVSDEDIYYCEDCEHDYCSDCTVSCHVCDTTICRECSFVCDECMETVCKHCIDDDGLCSNCQKQRKDNNNENITAEKIQAAQAKIQPDGVGQADIHA